MLKGYRLSGAYCQFFALIVLSERLKVIV